MSSNRGWDNLCSYSIWKRYESNTQNISCHELVAVGRISSNIKKKSQIKREKMVHSVLDINVGDNDVIMLLIVLL